jgi:hypothetical protein
MWVADAALAPLPAAAICGAGCDVTSVSSASEHLASGLLEPRRNLRLAAAEAARWTAGLNELLRRRRSAQDGADVAFAR